MGSITFNVCVHAVLFVHCCIQCVRHNYALSPFTKANRLPLLMVFQFYGYATPALVSRQTTDVSIIAWMNCPPSFPAKNTFSFLFLFLISSCLRPWRSSFLKSTIHVAVAISVILVGWDVLVAGSF